MPDKMTTAQSCVIRHRVILLAIIPMYVILLIVILLIVILLIVIVLIGILLFVVLLNVILLNVFMLNVFMLNVILLNVILQNAILLNAILPNVIMLNVILQKVIQIVVKCHSAEFHYATVIFKDHCAVWCSALSHSAECHCSYLGSLAGAPTNTFDIMDNVVWLSVILPSIIRSIVEALRELHFPTGD
jgi:hypothetical protein